MYNNSRLIKIKFQLKQSSKYDFHIEGMMYIDLNTYALVFLQYELLPTEKSFALYKEIWQKRGKIDFRMMFEVKDSYYYPSYFIEKQTGGRMIVPDWEENFNKKNPSNIQLELQIFYFFQVFDCFRKIILVNNMKSINSQFNVQGEDKGSEYIFKW